MKGRKKREERKKREDECEKGGVERKTDGKRIDNEVRAFACVRLLACVCLRAFAGVRSRACVCEFWSVRSAGTKRD